MRRNAGLTLIELLATTAIVAILLGIATPAWHLVHERLAASTTSHRLTSALAMARIAAVSRRTIVAVCASRDGRTCTGSSHWESGWLVFDDSARTGQPRSSSDVLMAADPAERLQVRSTDGRRILRFHANGRSPGSNVTFSICSARTGATITRTIVNNSGRVRTDRVEGTCLG